MGHRSVRAILLNEKYIGRWRWNPSSDRRSRQAHKSPARAPRAEQVPREYPGLAIIDRATWDHVQARLTRPPAQGSPLRLVQPPAASRKAISDSARQRLAVKCRP